jgi:hypothetical protein
MHKLMESDLGFITISNADVHAFGSVTGAMIPLFCKCCSSAATRSLIAIGSFHNGIQTGVIDGSTFAETVPSNLPHPSNTSANSSRILFVLNADPESF